MQIFGIYYNGISSIAKDCIVFIHENSIEILEKGSNHLIAHWNQENTTIKQISNSMISIAHMENEIEALIEIKLKSKEEFHALHEKLHFLEKDVASKIYKHGAKAIVPIGLFCLGFIAFFYFVLIPPIGEYFAAITPIVFENKLGENLSQGIEKDLKIDTEKSIRIQKYFEALHFKSEYKYKIQIVKEDKQVNAFAIPGGHIYIYTGILNKINSYEQLNALLFHEMAHVEYRHTLKSLYRLLSRMIFISLITSDVNSLSAVILEHANSLYALSYSKQLESEADSYSIHKMKEQKNDLQGFVDLFKTIENEAEHEIPSFLNTHPLTKERIKNGDKALKSQKSYIKDPIFENLFQDLK